MSDNGGDFGAFLAGFVIGGLVGAATALVLAPQSGQETRAQIGERSSSLRSAGEERWQQMRETAESSLSDTRTRVEEVGEQVQERARIVLDAGRKQAEQAADNLPPAAHDAAVPPGEPQ
ncbi:MAG: YtxH domain-containing protein [Anaerolineales bacterium]|nr:YtxH domain-containing protein [Anaerolineales bacterium]